MKKLRNILCIIVTESIPAVSFAEGAPCKTSGFNLCFEESFKDDGFVAKNYDNDDTATLNPNKKSFNNPEFSIEIHGEISVYQGYTKVKVRDYPKPE